MSTWQGWPPRADWGVERLDLDGYLARLAVSPAPPSREALDELHEAHVRAFTFDNIDVLLDQHPGVDLPAVGGKFVGRGRGGYCFEHATIFSAALERLGYDVVRRLGRVGEPTQAPRTHCVVLVTVQGERLLADPGFGLSLLRPLPLQDGAEDDYGGWGYRLRRVSLGTGARGWELHRRRERGWELMHTHDELPVHPVDFLSGHQFTSSYPQVHFRHLLMLTKHSPGRHTAVAAGRDGTMVTVRRPGEPAEHRPVRDGELRALLDELDVALTADETERLMVKVAALRRSP